MHRVDAIELREEIEEAIEGEEIIEFQFRGEEADLRTHFSGSATTEHPLTKALPLSGSMRVANMRKVVVLPAPLGSRRPKTTHRRRQRSSCVSCLRFSAVCVRIQRSCRDAPREVFLP